MTRPLVHTRRAFLRSGVGTAAAASLAAMPGLLPREARAAGATRIETQPLAPGLTLFSGAGCNVVALAGPDGALLVDGGLRRNSAALLAAVAKSTGTRKVHTLINTHWHPAQTGSNETLGRQGATIIAHEVTRLYLGRAVSSVDYEGLHGPLAAAGRPTRTTRAGDQLTFAGHPVHYGYLPAAHTNGDLYVHFPQHNVLVAGGPVGSEAWPLLDWRNGAWLGGLVKAHEKLAALVKPDTRVIPAHGRPIEGAELANLQRMFAAFHEKMVGFQNKGYDSGDCIAQRPLKEHEARFGDASLFVQGAFMSLNLAYSPD